MTLISGLQYTGDAAGARVVSVVESEQGWEVRAGVRERVEAGWASLEVTVEGWDTSQVDGYTERAAHQATELDDEQRDGLAAWLQAKAFDVWRAALSGAGEEQQA